MEARTRASSRRIPFGRARLRCAARGDHGPVEAPVPAPALEDVDEGRAEIDGAKQAAAAREADARSAAEALRIEFEVYRKELQNSVQLKGAMDLYVHAHVHNGKEWDYYTLCKIVRSQLEQRFCLFCTNEGLRPRRVAIARRS